MFSHAIDTLDSCIQNLHILTSAPLCLSSSTTRDGNTIVTASGDTSARVFKVQQPDRQNHNQILHPFLFCLIVEGRLKVFYREQIKATSIFYHVLSYWGICMQRFKSFKIIYFTTQKLAHGLCHLFGRDNAELTTVYATVKEFLKMCSRWNIKI